MCAVSGCALTAFSFGLHIVRFVRVLVVEDELRMAALLKRGLQEDGYVVDIAATGTDAVWQAGEFDYDVVLLDLMLPGLDGVEVCRQLRQIGRWVPVLMLSARDGVDDRVRGLDAGADDYLAKPFSFAELSARVRALIRRGAIERPTELRVADLRLNPATRQAWRGDTELELSGKEFALLELFLRHPGEVLTRTRILEHVWDFAYDGVSNVVDQYVLYLRRKVDRPFGVEQLETVRGAGYRLRVESTVAGAT
jgi:two-component system OmpR family response regulator